jgi:hypothetical protein
MQIEQTRNTPFINIDFENRIFEIKGPSYSENIVEIYTPLIEYIESNIVHLDGSLECELYFDVLNSISHKKIFQILISLNNFYQEGKDIKVKWYYDADDEDILEMGEDLMELIDIPFEIYSVEN